MTVKIDDLVSVEILYSNFASHLVENREAIWDSFESSLDDNESHRSIFTRFFTAISCEMVKDINSEKELILLNNIYINCFDEIFTKVQLAHKRRCEKDHEHPCVAEIEFNFTVMHPSRYFLRLAESLIEKYCEYLNFKTEWVYKVNTKNGNFMTEQKWEEDEYIQTVVSAATTTDPGQIHVVFNIDGNRIVAVYKIDASSQKTTPKIDSRLN